MSVIGKINKQSGFNFIWHIADFPFWLMNKKDIITSPVVRIEQLKGLDWKLSLHIPDEDEDNIRLSLSRHSTSLETPPRLEVDGHLFIAKTDNTCIFTGRFSCYFQVVNSFNRFPLIISKKSILEDSNMFLRRDTLTVGFQFFTNPSIPIECIGRSKLYLKEYSIYLPIEFPQMEVDGGQQTIISPVIFTSPEHPRIRIDLDCKKNNDEFPITIQIHMSNFVFNGFAKCNLLFFGKEGVKMKIERNCYYESDKEFPIVRVDISKDTFQEHSIFKADHLKCELVVSNGHYKSFLEKTTYVQNMRPSDSFCLETSYPQNFMEMYVTNSLSDFKVIVCGREFLTHKTVLAAASPVFRAMFESSMIESERSQVTVEDFSIRTVEKMLEFIYSGTVKDLIWDDALELYSIADKYQIKNLRFACYSFLRSALKVEKVPELLIFINPYNDAYLHKVIDTFFRLNSNAVLTSEVWKNFMKNNAQIACDTMYRICQSVMQ